MQKATKKTQQQKRKHMSYIHGLPHRMQWKTKLRNETTMIATM